MGENKYQEALDRLNTINMVNFIGDKELIKHKDNDIKTLQELVDKETPIKVTHQATIHSCCTCPNCLNVVDEFEEDYLGKRVRVTFDYCRFCGQKLDWSEE